MNNKFKNPYFWISIVAVTFSAAGIDFKTLTSWDLLFKAILSIIENPVAIVLVIIAILGVWNDNSTPGIDGFKIK